MNALRGSKHSNEEDLTPRALAVGIGERKKKESWGGSKRKKVKRNGGLPTISSKWAHGQPLGNVEIMFRL